MEFVYTNSFFWPVRDGVLIAAQRNTQPHKGLFGAVGEKNKRTSDGIETAVKAALRGACEELYNDTAHPEEFSNVYEVGTVQDTSHGSINNLDFVIGTLPDRQLDLQLRELQGLRPVKKLNQSHFYPAAQISLHHLRMACWTPGTVLHKAYGGKLAGQIPALSLQADVLANRLGAMPFIESIREGDYVPSENDLLWQSLRVLHPSRIEYTTRE